MSWKEIRGFSGLNWSWCCVFVFIYGIECVLRVFELHTMRLIASLQLLGGSGLWILLAYITSDFSGKKCEKVDLSVRWFVAYLCDGPPIGESRWLFLKGAAILSGVWYGFRCTHTFRKLERELCNCSKGRFSVWGEAIKASHWEGSSSDDYFGALKALVVKV